MIRSRGRPAHADTLTPAEWEVLDAVRHGMTNRRIAQRRGTTLDAVKFHLENIRAKLDLADRSALRHWAGIPAHMRTKERTMTQATNISLGPIGQVAHTVTDIERSVAFFRDVVGLPHLFTAGELAFFDCGGTRLFLDALPEAQGNGNSCIYFTVPDIHAAQEALAARGAPFEGAPHMIFRHPDGTEEWMTFFRDPDGSMLALMSSVPPA